MSRYSMTSRYGPDTMNESTGVPASLQVSSDMPAWFAQITMSSAPTYPVASSSMCSGPDPSPHCASAEQALRTRARTIAPRRGLIWEKYIIFWFGDREVCNCGPTEANRERQTACRVPTDRPGESVQSHRPALRASWKIHALSRRSGASGRHEYFTSEIGSPISGRSYVRRRRVD